jgi:SHS2 domain-containing protein
VGDPNQGYRELAHTADWELEVWAPDMSGLLCQAADGMYRLMAVELASGPRQRRRLELEADDRESLLVEFLQELLFLCESDGLAFDSLELCVEDLRLQATLEGAPVASQAKEIKAVTFHRLAVQKTARGFETRVVFDV